MGPACTKCGVVKPRTFEFFYRQAATSDGFTSWCRVCDAEKGRLRAREKRAAGFKRKYDPEKARKYTATYKAKHSEKVKTRSRELAKKRREDPGYRAMSSMSRRIRECISRNFAGSLRHLPYSAEELKSHIERQFDKNMNWQNYGEVWHIDHIQPVASFQLTGKIDREFQACWALSNLRPLAKLENLSKHSRRTHLL